MNVIIDCSRMNQKQIQVKAQDDILKGAYANIVQISHTKEEVIFDFLNIIPPQGQLVSRVITSPGHAKRILKALEENIKKYESQYGTIAAAEAPKTEFGFSA